MHTHPAGSYDYLAVGHVTIDVLFDHDGEPRIQPGGSAFYSGLQAARLGLRTLLITRGEPHRLRELLEPFADELTVQIVPSHATSTFETHGSGASRRQWVRAWAGLIPASAVSASTSILHLAPVARETPRTSQSLAGFVGMTPQGLLRRWRQDGEIELAQIEASELPSNIDALVISKSERACCKALLERAPLERAPLEHAPLERAPLEHAPLVAITAGEGPTEVHMPDGSVRQVAPAAVRLHGVHDDLGAGDVFAAAFFVALQEGCSPPAAACFGNAAAAVRIGGDGPDAIGDREAIERGL
jgi:sugar/nucleoside kinase (ribokinase family)